MTEPITVTIAPERGQVRMLARCGPRDVLKAILVSPITTKRVKVTSRSDDERARSAATRTAAITPSAAPGDAA